MNLENEITVKYLIYSLKRNCGPCVKPNPLSGRFLIEVLTVAHTSIGLPRFDQSYRI